MKTGVEKAGWQPAPLVPHIGTTNLDKNRWNGAGQPQTQTQQNDNHMTFYLQEDSPPTSPVSISEEDQVDDIIRAIENVLEMNSSYDPSPDVKPSIRRRPSSTYQGGQGMSRLSPVGLTRQPSVRRRSGSGGRSTAGRGRDVHSPFKPRALRDSNILVDVPPPPGLVSLSISNTKPSNGLGISFDSEPSEASYGRETPSSIRSTASPPLTVQILPHTRDNLESPLSCITDTFSLSDSESKSFSDIAYDSDSESYYFSHDEDKTDVQSVYSKGARFSSYEDCIDRSNVFSICEEGDIRICMHRSEALLEELLDEAMIPALIELNSQDEDSKEVSTSPCHPAPVLSCRVESVSMLDFPEFIPADDDEGEDGDKRNRPAPPPKTHKNPTVTKLLRTTRENSSPPNINDHPAFRAQDPLAISRETMRQEWTEWPPVKLNINIPKSSRPRSIGITSPTVSLALPMISHHARSASTSPQRVRINNAFSGQDNVREKSPGRRYKLWRSSRD